MVIIIVEHKKWAIKKFYTLLIKKKQELFENDLYKLITKHYENFPKQSYSNTKNNK